MKRIYALLSLLLVLIAGMATLPPTPAFADSLDDAKAAGYVGERPDGYLGMVKSAPADVNRLVQDINDKRRAHYARIAQQNTGADVRDVAAIAGAKAIKRAPKGTYVMDASGAWIKK